MRRRRSWYTVELSRKSGAELKTLKAKVIFVLMDPYRQRPPCFPEAEDFFWAGAQPQMKTKMKDLSVLRALPKAADAEAEMANDS
jgi:hypothetical protein